MSTYCEPGNGGEAAHKMDRCCFSIALKVEWWEEVDFGGRWCLTPSLACRATVDNTAQPQFPHYAAREGVSSLCCHENQ